MISYINHVDKSSLCNGHQFRVIPSPFAVYVLTFVFPSATHPPEMNGPSD